MTQSKTRGKSGWVTSPGGLVSALVPIVRARGGAWVGWSGTTGAAPAPFDAEGISNIPVPLKRGELASFYHGQCNSTFWPLYHDAIREPEYHRYWWSAYVDVNRRFAKKAAEVAAPGGLVWIHDYHLQLVPRMLRELRNDVTIGFFLHIPFPPTELFRRLPWRREIVDGLLGADMVGFQTRAATSNFRQLAASLVGAKGRGKRVELDGRSIEIGTFPISIDVAKFESVASRTEVQQRARKLGKSLRGNRTLLLAVDRLDYTKGIELRLKAFKEWLRRSEATGASRAVLVQVAVPSREQIAGYRELRSRVEELVGQINGEYGELGRVPVQYLRRNLPIEDLVAMYLAADVMLVTPLRDGMNLVAKEYVTSRLDHGGCLVLSEFTGAAEELRDALQVNPHDIDGVADQIERAIQIEPAEGRRRMRSMRRAVARHTVHDWASAYLEALAV